MAEFDRIFFLGTWTWKYDKNLELHEELIVRVMEIIVAFHCSKDSSRSFMGMNIVKNSLLILNHILCDMQEVKVRNWGG